MGGCQSSSGADSKLLHVDVQYCGGNTVKPYFQDLEEHLKSVFGEDLVSIHGYQDMMFSGRFEVKIRETKELIHSKKTVADHGWARRPEERDAIVGKIQAELDKRREQAQE